MSFISTHLLNIYSRAVAADRSSGSPEPERQRGYRGMGRAGDGRRCAAARLQHSHPRREEDHVDGSRSGGRGRAKVQHQRPTSIYRP